MLANDLVKYKEEYPIKRSYPQSKILKEKRRKKFNKKERIFTSIDNIRANNHKVISKNFDGINKVGGEIGFGLKGILSTMSLMATMVVVVGTAFLGINKILEGMGKLAEGQTVLDLAKPSTYGSSGRSSGKLSEKGLQMIRDKEGFHNGTSYQDSAGVWTIGYGHTGKFKGKPIGRGMTITKAEADELLRQDVAKFENIVNSSVKVPISQNMFDALVVFCYNVGPGNFKSSTLLKKLNAGDYKGAQAEFAVWNKAKDKKTGKKVVVEGLTKRRAEEAALFGIDIGQDGKLKGEVINKETPRTGTKTGGISDNYGGSYNIKYGAKIGNYTMKDSKGNDLIMSGQMEQFFKEVSSDYGGYGNVTSVMDGEHAGTKYNAGSHYSGNKADIGLRGLNKAGIIKQCVPIMRHPALVHVAFEGLGRNDKESKEISRDIERTIRQQYPDINNRLNRKEFVIKHWGHKYSSSPHIDICINPNKLKNVPSAKPTTTSTSSANNKKIEDNNAKLKETKKPTTQKPKPQKQETKPTKAIVNTQQNPTNNNTKDISTSDPRQMIINQENNKIINMKYK